MSTFTHLDQHGQANMVDISDKPASIREASARGFVKMQPATLHMIEQQQLAKGDVLTTARIAGIQAAKRCGELIPLCHPLMLSKVAVNFELDPANHKVWITASCKLTGSTGVEMEALTAVSVAALTLFDMCKAVDKHMQIGGIEVMSKSGGKHGEWTRDAN